MMTEKMNHTQAFAHFGAKPKNVRWSWSAVSDDGETAVVTLWQGGFSRRDGKLVYDGSFGQDSRPGQNELRETLKWAYTNCHRRLNAIIAIARDPGSESRRIKDCFPAPMTMRLTHLDLEGGKFSL